ncbi:unnamed protein product, partial [Mesorhabditis belari]|uniref:Thioesterase domain-containing protein n=1 Tax=Mesorhabditis belari TaxID=2138241 RepID=A0AAF3JAA7_9BILA
MSSSAALMKRLQLLFSTYKHMNPFMNCGVEEFRVISVDQKRYRTEFEVTKDMVNPINNLHGGCSATLLDIGCSAAAFVRGKVVLSINQEITVVAPAKLGDTVLMDIELVRLGKTQCYTRGELIRKADSQVIVFGTCTYTVPPMRVVPGPAHDLIDQLSKIN